MKRDGTEVAAPVPRACNAGGGAEAGTGKRFSAKKELAAVQRLLRGESLETVSRDLQIPTHRLSAWHDQALAGVEGALKERERDARGEENERLKAKVGELTMATELLNAKIDRLETGHPFVGRRSRR